MDLDKTAFGGAHQVGGRREVADSGSVDDGRGRGELIPAGGGRGVPAFVVAGEFGGLRRCLGDDGVDQGRLADAGLADQQTHAAGEQALEIGNAVRGLAAHLDAGEVQLSVFVELRLNCIRAQIFFVHDDQRSQVLEHGAGPVAVHQEPVCGRLGRHDHDQLVDIRRHRLGASARVDSFDEIAARLDGLYRRAVGGWRIAPYDPITAHHTQFAPLEPAAHEAFAPLDQDASAETREDGAGAACYHHELFP